MTASEQLIKFIDSTYKNPREDHAVIVARHGKIIEALLMMWVSVEEKLPELNEAVFCIQDLRKIGKCAFVSEYFYSPYGFVNNIGDDDVYGYITHWISASVIDEQNFDDLLKEMS